MADNILKNKKILGVFAVTMINVIAVDSLRTLPFSAAFGLSLVFFYILAAIMFFLPIALISAELATGWPSKGGIYVWVREAFGERWGFVVIWLQWVYNIVWYPTILAFIAGTIAYLVAPNLAENKIFMLTTILTILWAATLLNFFSIKVSSIVSQSEIPRHLPSFAAGVRNALRRKPRLILVGEARDPETIAAVMEAAMTGHPVYTTLHSNGVAETMRRLVITFPPEERQGRTIDINETVRLVISQRLVTTVDGKRVALREYLILDEKVRDILLEADILNITNVVRKLVREQGRTMEVDAREKLQAGMITERQYYLIAEQAKREEKDTGGI